MFGGRVAQTRETCGVTIYGCGWMEGYRTRAVPEGAHKPFIFLYLMTAARMQARPGRSRMAGSKLTSTNVGMLNAVASRDDWADGLSSVHSHHNHHVHDNVSSESCSCSFVAESNASVRNSTRAFSYLCNLKKEAKTTTKDRWTLQGQPPPPHPWPHLHTHAHTHVFLSVSLSVGS